MLTAGHKPVTFRSTVYCVISPRYSVHRVPTLYLFAI